MNHSEEIKNLIESIEHYRVQLKRPVWKYTFDKEDSHDIAKRIIAREKKGIL